MLLFDLAGVVGWRCSRRGWEAQKTGFGSWEESSSVSLPSLSSLFFFFYFFVQSSLPTSPERPVPLRIMRREEVRTRANPPAPK